MIITLKELKSVGLCIDGRKLFKLAFPDGSVNFNETSLKKLFNILEKDDFPVCPEDVADFINEKLLNEIGKIQFNKIFDGAHERWYNYYGTSENERAKWNKSCHDASVAGLRAMGYIK